MPSCAAFGCSNHPDRDRKRGITFHAFPKNLELNQQWVKAVRRKNFTPSKRSVLCSAHFSEEDMDRTSLSCIRVRDGAVPTVFPSFPAYLQTAAKKPRKAPMERVSPTSPQVRNSHGTDTDPATERIPNECIVPGCKSHYATSANEKNSVPLFPFPSDPLRRELWLNLLPNRPFVLSPHSCICFKHFHDRFIIKREPEIFKQYHIYCLTPDAYPSIFSGIENGLSVANSNTKAAAKFRRILNNSKSQIDNWLLTDKIISFTSFCDKAKDYLGGDRWKFKLGKPKAKYDKHCIQFYLTFVMSSLDESRPCLTVFSDMHIKVHRDVLGDIPERDLNEIFGEQSPPILTYWSQFAAVLSQCSTGYWVSSSDFHPSVCIVDLSELSVIEDEDQAAQLFNEESPLCTEKSSNDSLGNDNDSNKNLRKENLLLTRKLYNAIFQRNQLLEKMEIIQDLASINLDVLNLILVPGGSPLGREEVEKVFRLVETIKNDSEEMTVGHDVYPAWIKKNSNVIQDDRLLQLKFPAFQVSLPTFDTAGCQFESNEEEMTERHDKSDSLTSNTVSDQRCVTGSSVIDKEQEEGDRTCYDKDLLEHQGHDENEHGYFCTDNHVCQFCGRKFRTRMEANQHQNIFHKDIIVTQCHICGKIFKNGSHLKAHLSIHSDNTQFQCFLCGKYFKQKTYLQKHTRTVHTTEKKYFECSICGCTFKRRDNCKRHEKKHASDDNRIPRCTRGPDDLHFCKFCSTGFKDLNSLHEHTESAHSGERPFHCDLCGKSFKLERCLRMHQVFHSEKRPFKCTLCPKTFKTSGQLNKHRRVHVGEKEYTCDICGEMLKCPQSFEKHKATHSENFLDIDNNGRSLQSQQKDQEIILNFNEDFKDLEKASNPV